MVPLPACHSHQVLQGPEKAEPSEQVVRVVGSVGERCWARGCSVPLSDLGGEGLRQPCRGAEGRLCELYCPHISWTSVWTASELLADPPSDHAAERLSESPAHLSICQG